MKKFLMAVCAGLLSLGLWADSVTTNGVTWTFSVSNGRATLGSECISTSVKGALEIPDMLGGYPVTDIGPSAFSGCSKLTEIIIPASVTNIAGGTYPVTDANLAGMHFFKVLVEKAAGED